MGGSAGDSSAEPSPGRVADVDAAPGVVSPPAVDPPSVSPAEKDRAAAGAGDGKGGGSSVKSSKKQRLHSGSKPSRELRQRAVTAKPDAGEAAADTKRVAAPKAVSNRAVSDRVVSGRGAERVSERMVAASPVARPTAVVDVGVAVSPVKVTAAVVKAVDRPPVDEAVKPSVPVRVVSGLLSGLGGSAGGGGDPVVPVGLPAGWAVPAWTRSRMAQGQQSVASSAPEAQVFSGQTLEAAPLAAAAPSSAPTLGLRANVAQRSDRTAPKVVVSAPSGTVSGTVNLSATASDNVGVAGVQFLVDGTAVGAEDTGAPYSVAFNTTTVANGTHTVTARARDAAGNTKLSSPVTLRVANSDVTAPTVAVTAPSGTVSGTVNLSATASDNVGVTGVQFLVNGTAVGAEDTGAPYSVAFNTTTVANGTHTVTARARDAAGNTTTSQAVTVTVANAENHPPVVTTGPRIDGTDPATGTITGWFNVTDMDFQTFTTTYSPTIPSGSVNVTSNMYSPGFARYRFTYVPSVEARQQAAVTTVPDTASFVIAISDGTTSTNVDVTVPILPPSSAPPAITGSVLPGDPNDATGAVIGTLGVTDPDTPVLSYTLTSDPARGAVTFNAVAGTFTYTPTPTERLSGGVDDFTVEVTDGNLGVTVNATVPVRPVALPATSYSIPGIQYPNDLRVWGSRAYVTDGGSIKMIDTATDSVVATKVLPGATSLAVSADGSRIYVATAWDRVSVLDGNTLAPVGNPIAITSGGWVGGSMSISPDGRHLYVPFGGGEGGGVVVVDTVTGANQSLWVGSGSPNATLNPDGTLLYLLDRSNSALNVFDTRTMTETAIMHTGMFPSDVVFSQDGGRAYITTALGVVDVVDVASSTIIAGIPLGNTADHYTNSRPLSEYFDSTIALGPDGTNVFVARGDDIFVIDSSTNAVVGVVPMGNTYAFTNVPIAVAPDGSIYTTADLKVKVFDIGGTVANMVSPESGEAAAMALTAEVAPMALTAEVAPMALAAAAVVTPGFVQVSAATPQSNRRSVGVTYSGAQVAGDTNVVVIGWRNATSNITSVTDSAGNVYKPAVSTFRGNGVSQAIYYAANVKSAAAGGNTVTVSFDRQTPYVDVRALEYSGLDPVSPLDVVRSAGGSGALANSGSVTTAAANALIVGAGYTRGAFSGAGSNFTSRIVTVDGVAQDRVVTAAGPYSATAPVSGGAWVMQVAVFKAATVANPDVTAPSVNVTTPAGSVSGTVSLTANASDNVGVTGVQFLVNGSPIGNEDPAAPYAVAWNTTSVANGSYALAARARDAAGNTTTSTAVNLIVNNPDVTAPSVAVAGPSGTVSGTANLSATANDNVGVAGVQFLVNGSPIGNEDPAAPYAVAWNTTSVANGSYALTARARDAAGNTTTSQAVNVTVANPDVTAPTVVLTTLSGTVSGTVNLAATANDNVGVAGVQFLVDGNAVGAEDTGVPYAVSFDTRTVGNGPHAVTALARDAAGNTTTSAAVTLTVNNAVNSAPTAAPTQQAPNQSTGATTGSINGSDVYGNTLSYTLTAAPANGTTNLNPTTGAFTYTPTQAARFAADMTGIADSDTFTVGVSNGTIVTSVPVNVAIPPARILDATTSAQTGTAAMGMAISATKGYVANQASNTVSVIDRSNPNAAPVTINVVASPRAIALSPDGARAYVAGTGGVSVINTANNQVIATVVTSAGDSHGIAVVQTGVNTHRVYVTNAANSTVRVINANTATNAYSAGGSVQVGSGPRGIAVSADGTRAYVANWSSNSVSVLDTTTATPSVIRTITVGTNPFGMAVSPDGAKVYVANYGSNSISVLNPTAANPLVTSIALGSQPLGLAVNPDGSLLYAVNGAHTVSMITTEDNSLYSTLTFDPPPNNAWHSIALSPEGNQIFTSGFADRRVRIFTIITPTQPWVAVTAPSGPVWGTVNLSATASGTVGVQFLVDDVNVGAEDTGSPYAVSWDSTKVADGTHTVTARARDAAGNIITSAPVSVIVANASLAMPTVTTSAVSVGSGPSGVAVSGAYAYVINYVSNDVTVIDSATNQVVKTLQVGDGPLSVAASPNRNRVYVSNSLSNSVSVIDSTRNEVIDTIAIEVLPGVLDYDGWPYEYPNRLTEVVATDTRLYVNATDGRVTVVDITNDAGTGKDANRVLRTAGVGRLNDLKVSPDGSRLYGTPGTGLAVIDTATMTAVGVNVGPSWDGSSMRSEFTNSTGNVAVSPDGKRTYVAYSVTIVERGIGGSSSGYFITDSGGRTWKVTGQYGAVAVIDTDPESANFNKEIARIGVPLWAQDLIVAGNLLYVTTWDGKSVSVIDTDTNALAGTFTTDQTNSVGRAIYLPDDWYPLFAIAAYSRYITVGPNGTVYVTDYSDGVLYSVTPGSAVL